MGRVKIAVTGASGFIGRNLCKELGNNGFDVVAIIRDESKRHLLKLNNVQVTVASSCWEWNTLNVFKGCDVVIHLVGRAHVLDDQSSNPIDEFRKANVQTIDSLLDSIRNTSVRRIVLVSTIGVNGAKTSGNAFSETHRVRPHDAYSASKFEAEERLRDMAKDAKVEYVIVRPPLVFGPNAPGNFKTILKLAKKNIPLPFKAFKARRNIISVWNLVAFLQICSVHPAAANEMFLVADKQAVDLREIFIELRKGMEAAPRIWFVPLFIFQIMASLFPKRRRQLAKLNSELLVDSRKAETLLGWRPIFSTSEGLRKTGKEHGELNEADI